MQAAYILAGDIGGTKTNLGWRLDEKELIPGLGVRSGPASFCLNLRR